MFFYWFLGGGVLGLILGKTFELWNRLDSNTKKLIIERFVKTFEEIFRVYYKLKNELWKHLDNNTKKLITEQIIKVFKMILNAYYRWCKNRGDK